MLTAACLLAYYGFLRRSEFTIPSLQAYNPTHHLSTTDIKVDSHNTPSIIAVHIKSSKTDPFGKGTTIYLGKGRSSLCPVAAILRYLAIRPSDNGPLFIDHSGKPLTKPAFVAHIKQALEAVGIKSNAYKGHSFRIGAATMAAACGLEDSTIKTLEDGPVQHFSCTFEPLLQIWHNLLFAYQWYLMSNTYEASTDMTVDGLFILGSDLFSRYLTCI